ncbi:MAG TPA: glutamine synthetase family protein [Rubrobacter sp.]|nr:glutamine synthetase family protein [Rubrobacter sp.]
MRGQELVAFLHSDLSGLNRGRSVPVSELNKRLATGVGWVPADQALTPLGPLAEPNPWGSLGDLRLLPGRDTQVRVDLWEDASPLHFFLCDAANTDGSPWDACPRTLLKDALARLEHEAGLRLIASFEQEFFLDGLPGEPGPGFSLEAQRLVEPFGSLLIEALRQANLEPEMFLPEYGLCQYEVPCAPAEGVAAADRASAMREVTREVARRCGYRASFTPKVEPDGVGNGVHVHLSLVDLDGRPVFYDADRPGDLSLAGARFAAGILEHLPALCAFTAPSVVSYLRLRPHHWSASLGCLSERNREAAIRIPALVELANSDVASQFNLEFRAADAAACPHLALAVLVLAGLHGLQEELGEPPLVEGDPSDLDEEERWRLGIRPLPSSLGDALEALEADAVVRSWFSQDLWDCYLSVKRTEMALLEGSEPKEACQRYLRVY